MSKEKKIEGYLHLYYSAEVWCGDNIGLHYNKKIDPEFLGDFYNDCFKIVKPILRPLSSMTEEERKELWQLVFKKEFGKNGSVVFIDKVSFSSDPRWVMSSGVDRLGVELNGTVWADVDLDNFKHNQHEITRYFLSKSFDLFGLIESGIAIDSETLTQPHP